MTVIRNCTITFPNRKSGVMESVELTFANDVEAEAFHAMFLKSDFVTKSAAAITRWQGVMPHTPLSAMADLTYRIQNAV
jgi:hypothetical protein